VTWNDHLADPDNPTQARQIDVTVRREGLLTLVECRHHKSRQDVQWIEELMGRRTSLAAHAVVAVSSSGFTAGAQAKARKHAIILRDLDKLSDGEVVSWSHRVALTLFFYEYSELEVSLLFDRRDISKVAAEQIQSELRSHPCVQSLFNASARKLDEANLMAHEQIGRSVDFGLRIEFDGVRLSGKLVLEAKVTGKARLIAQQVSPSVASGYGAPGQPFAAREAAVEAFPSLGNTSIIHSGDRISTFLDLSELTIPPFCQFRFWRQDAGEELDHEILELQLGRNFEQLKVSGKGLNVRLFST